MTIAKTRQPATSLSDLLDIEHRVPEPGAISPAAILALIEWLSGDEAHALDEASLTFGLGRRLRSLGLPVDQLTLHLMTLHPEIVGRSVAWSPNEPIQIRDREHGTITQTFLHSALWKAMNIRDIVIAGRGDVGDQWEQLDVFAGRDLVELMIVPLCNADGPVSAASFGTKRPGGFTVSERQVIERIMPSLRNACEIRTLRQVELSLLDTYIGPMTAQRILAGQIRKGEIETMEAALMLCDLRRFTELSNRLPGERVLELLNVYFDAVVPAIAREGGEVLKFMGDAVLAVFPSYDATRSSAAALTSAKAILTRLEKLHFSDARLQAGIALHYGEVSYGNIGSGRRLDFTVIGPDVNLVSRIQGVCSDSGEPLLMSRDFATMLSRQESFSIGSRFIKGFDEEIELFALASISPLAGEKAKSAS
ncbi:adenylate/guanylate cyclase domain-containing protein [Rhizobium calliandrae]|uniref:Adenylate/guanylate cyclase domain-containing protein n=1 Tax=Rhizobium calliandrae TaxID=1312182 RepID=A0ABT7KEY9_9HYPH|nr:adenylate/guanylate cyclase domain-containing protein [Rhizobium calliandrae]MDL2407181.1 adenylate/guanylate cyclase domain-containing protein [Rhizobium calliandrae]